MKPYHQRFYDEELAPLDLRDRAVVEIGSGEGELLAMLRGRPDRPMRLVGVNGEAYPAKAPEGIELILADVVPAALHDNSFDLAYSLATFEHIHDLPGTLREIRRILKPGGQLISVWSPIWNGFNGHHFGTTLSHPTHRDIELPWAHLIFGKNRLAEYLVVGEGFSPPEAKDAVAFIYDTPLLNFRTVRDYREAIAGSGFEAVRFECVRVDLAGLLERVQRKIACGALAPGDFLAFLRNTPEEEVMTYKLRVTLRKPPA